MSELRKSYHVIAAMNGGWSVKKFGVERSLRNFNTRRQAINFARKISKNNNAELIIHNEDGRLANKIIYRKEPTSIISAKI
jgi:hypothetical protein